MGLHPRLQELLHGEGWEGFSATQDAAFPPLLERRHALVIAPTGTGKTEAAVLPVLHHLLVERERLAGSDKPWPVGFKALFITPLRALNRDLLRRLEGWCDQLGLTIGVRHGDTSQSERAKQSRNPPDVLITTPETTQLLLYGDKLRGHLATVRFVIVDEVHDLATSERGAQLAVALERIEEVIAQPPALRAAPARERTCPTAPSARPEGMLQRIGLSATVADPHAVARVLAGGREVCIVQVDTAKSRVVHVVHPEPTQEDDRLAGELAAPVEAIAQLRVVRELVQTHRRVLVFHNTRDSAELMTSRSALVDEALGEAPLLELHHGSLSAEHRLDVETRFRDGGIHGLVATSSLELGIDVGAIDHVVQVMSPRSSARFIQRLGRAGHRIGATSEGTIVSTGPEDHLECVAVARMARDGVLEPLHIRDDPLIVLVNQIIALSNEYAGLDAAWVRGVVSRAGPFLELDEGMFDAVWDTLVDVRTVPEEAGRIVRSGRARRHFLRHISLIPDTITYGILDESTKRRIGSVDDAYVAAAMRPGDLFVMAGRPWKVLETDAERKLVRVGPTKMLGAIPQWSGEMLPVGYELAQAVARLRGEVATRDGSGWGPAADPVHRHMEAGLAVPTDERITLDAGKGVVVAGVALGTRGNDALGRITAALLHQRIGAAVTVESDAYRIHFSGPIRPADIEDTWRTLDAETIDLLLGMIVKDQPIVKQHLVQVAKHFGALPPELDPNRFSRKKMEELWGKVAVQEETLSRLLHDRFDLRAVQDFLRRLDRLEIVHQAFGPLSRMASHQARMMIVPRRDEKLLEAVRRRIEEADVMLVCTNCRSRLDMLVQDVPERVHCRRCGHNAVACMRPWQDDLLPALAKDPSAAPAEVRNRRKGLEKNGRLMATYGRTAAACLVGRGIGADTAARILQKCSDLDDPDFWRLILQAELEFAQNSHWRQRK